MKYSEKQPAEVVGNQNWLQSEMQPEKVAEKSYRLPGESLGDAIRRIDRETDERRSREANAKADHKECTCSGHQLLFGECNCGAIK